MGEPRRFVMSHPIPLRADFNASGLRRLARDSKDASQARRLLALATIYAGGTRLEAAEIGGVGLQIVRDWVVRFNAEGPPGLIDKKAPGQRPLLNAAHRCAVARMVEDGPIPAVHGVVRWRLVDLVQRVWEEYRIAVSETTMGRVLNEMGYRKLSARPRHHAQDPDAMDIFKKTSPPLWRRSRAARRSAQR
jgi:transposase